MANIEAPFTPDQIASLNAYQEHPEVQPVLCGADPLHGDLIAVVSGWMCCCCDYQQPWAYDWQADWSWNILSDKPAGFWYTEALQNTVNAV